MPVWRSAVHRNLAQGAALKFAVCVRRSARLWDWRTSRGRAPGRIHSGSTRGDEEYLAGISPGFAVVGNRQLLMHGTPRASGGHAVSPSAGGAVPPLSGMTARHACIPASSCCGNCRGGLMVWRVTTRHPTSVARDSSVLRHAACVLVIEIRPSLSLCRVNPLPLPCPSPQAMRP